MYKIFSLLFAAAFSLNATAGTLTEIPADDLDKTVSDVRPVEDSDKNLLKAALKGWTVKLGAGFNIGGAAPLPLPAEIRKIEGFKPRVNFAIQGDASKQFGKSRWGMMVGVRFEMKGMETDAKVKSYRLRATNPDGGVVNGVWTGNVKTKVNNSYLSFPILATCKFGERWKIGFGPYLAYMINGEFSGEAYDGYIRDTDPTGEKAEVAVATYDYSSSLRHFHWGVQAGAEFRAYKHLLVTAYLQWGLNDIFPDDFADVSFALYPIYGTVGFAYEF